VIAAINGHAVGVGITMTLPMDIRVVSEDAKIGLCLPGGELPEACSAWFLPRIVGFKAAEWLYLACLPRLGRGNLRSLIMWYRRSRYLTRR
jgi:enoyl-CoA hydratase/carnithine racemase